MALRVTQKGKRTIVVPQKIVAKGSEAVEAYVAEKRKPKKQSKSTQKDDQ